MLLPRLPLVISLVAGALLTGTDGRADGVPRTRPARGVDAATGTTFVFPYQQRRLLYSRNADGGLAYVSSGAERGATLPVVVLLHGMNPDELVHPWFGPPYGDVRLVVEALIASGKTTSVVIAAPTHTRYATGATVMWPRFDLDDFLDATEAALRESATLDRSRVVVIGHSGAGCNTTGGILAESVRRAKPLALVDVDGCLDEPVRSALTQASASVPVHFFWQRSWARPVAELVRACPECKVEEVADFVPGTSPHVAILPEALRRVLPALLPGDAR